MIMVDRASLTPSPASRPKVFDPFAIGPDHHKHSQSTSIIKLEECNRVFCPLCLEKNPTDGVERASEELYNQFVKNLFEALDQNSENIQVRLIVIPTLTIVLKIRPIIIKSDHEFHNILRVIYKLMMSHQFNLNEFTKIVAIYSIISERYIQANPIPYLSIWKATDHMLQYVEKQFKKFGEQAGESAFNRSPNFFSSAARIVKTYLDIVGRFALEKVSDLIFPLYENDDPLKHNKIHYINTQIKCLDFMCDGILDRCWAAITDSRQPLAENLAKMAEDMFVALDECIKSATRLNYKKFLDFLLGIDILAGSHHLISINRNRNSNLRSKIESFLKSYVFFYIESDFGNDQTFRKLKQSERIVETNYRNAIAVSLTKRFRRTIFYLLINCVAMKQKSRYFKPHMFKRVVKCIDAEAMQLRGSKVLIRVYSYLIAANVPKLSIYDNVEGFIIKVWRDMRDKHNNSEFDEEFCYDQTVLHWAFEHPDFIKMVTIGTIRYINERSVKQGSVERNLRLLMKNKHYKPIVVSYLKDDESVAYIIDEIAKTDENLTVSEEADHEALVTELSAITLALLHDSLLEFINNGNYSCVRRTYRLINIVVIMLNKCRHFKLILDDQVVTDLFRFVELIYKEESEKFDEIIVITNEFMAAIMSSNSLYLMKILKYLDFTALGYMFHRLADYTRGDQVAESIARLLIAYDNIDYPLQYAVDKNLCRMPDSVLNWTLSENEDLRRLSLKVAAKVLTLDFAKSLKIRVTTGVLHMLITTPQMLQIHNYLEEFLSILSIDELLYNPLLDRLMDNVPASIKEAIEDKMFSDRPRSLSPALSFDSDDSCNFEADRNTVASILARLEEDDMIQRTSNHRIPSALYVSQNIQDQNIEHIDCDIWAERATQINREDKNAPPF